MQCVNFQCIYMCHRKHVSQSFVQDILHQLCHVKNNIQNTGNILNRFTVGQHRKTKMLNLNWTEVKTILVLEQKKAPGNLCTGLVQRWVSKSSAHRATKLLKLCLYKIAAIQ
jgi:hypothetical protein